MVTPRSRSLPPRAAEQWMRRDHQIDQLQFAAPCSQRFGGPPRAHAAALAPPHGLSISVCVPSRLVRTPLLTGRSPRLRSPPRACAAANLRNVMKQATALATGQGVPHTRYDRWFRKGRPVTLDEDLVKLRAEANVFLLPEDDPGHGWRLDHPIGKMCLFQAFLAEKNRKK